MTTETLLATLSQRGVCLWGEGEALRYRAPHGALTVELRQAMQQQKPALLALLRQADPDDTPRRVGRQVAPCPECGDTWQWPTTGGGFICSGCVVAGKGPSVQSDTLQEEEPPLEDRRRELGLLRQQKNAVHGR